MMWSVVEGAAVAAMAGAMARAARVDLERRIIPNWCPAVVAASGLVASLARLADARGPGPLVRSVGGAATVLLVMGLAAAASRQLTGRRGVGGGDVKLLAAAGVWTGPAQGLAVVAWSCLASLALYGIVAAFATLSGHKHVISRSSDTAGGIPLGPGIALSTLTVVLLGRP